jgi:carboxymethylenebutenolidase
VQLIDQNSARHLRPLVSDVQAQPRAAVGKVALIGLSIGGAVSLRASGDLADQVSAVVAYYPALAALGHDHKALASRLRVPVLVIAGEKDSYLDCCPIAAMRSLQEVAQVENKPLQLVVYPAAGHVFNLAAYPHMYRHDDSEDAWLRTLAFLREHHALPAQ